MLASLAPVLSGVGVAPATNSYFSIATQTVGSGGVSSITFGSIPSTWTHLQIRGITNNQGNQDDLALQFNGDTGGNYSWHMLVGNGSTAGAYNGTSTTYIREPMYCNGVSPYFGVGITDILDYTNTNKYKTVRMLAGADNNQNNTTSQVYLTSGLWMNTAAITSITLKSTQGFNISQYSSFALYGVK
jgi:hypothetical protein